MDQGWEKEIAIQFGMAKGIDKIFSMVKTLIIESKQKEEEGENV